MFSEERKSIILNMLNENSSVSLADLMERFGASETTVRRDLTELELAGALKRTHGGAVPVTHSIFEPNYLEKENACLDEKHSIAKAAAELVQDGETVLLDAGTTTAEIARLLVGKKITLITNSTIITSDFLFGKGADVPHNIEIYSTGGQFRPTTQSLVGPAAENFIRQIRPDKSFIAANGITPEAGATTANMSEASVKSAMIAVSKESYLAADHSKFGQEYFSVIAKADAFTGIITDAGIADSWLSRLRRKRVRVIVAPPYGRRENRFVK